MVNSESVVTSDIASSINSNNFSNVKHNKLVVTLDHMFTKIILLLNVYFKN